MKNGICTRELMKSLSDDAKVLLGCYFGPMGIPGRSSLTFGMKEVKPTERAQVALDDLVKRGAMMRRNLCDGAVEYVVQINCSEFGQWVRRNMNKCKWPATEPIATTNIASPKGL